MKAVYLPSNLDLKTLLIEQRPDFRYDLEKFYYLIGLVIWMQASRKSNLEGDFAPLYSPLLQRKIKDYNLYLRYLVEHGILETNGYYEPGKKSTGYKLAERYMQSEPVYTKLSSYTLTKQPAKEVLHRKYLQRRYGHLTKWFNDKLQIDYGGALGCLKDLYNKELKRGYKSKSKNKKPKTPQERYFLRRINVDRFERQEFDYSVDGTSHRFHSILTGVKSEVRNYITYDGQNLCSVDVKNSQPFLSTVLFNPAFYSEKSENLSLISIAPTIYKQLLPTIPQVLSLLTNISTITMLVKSDETQCSSDLELYCTLVDKGRLYPFFSDRFYEETGIRFNLEIPEEKREIKEWFFWILYSQNRYKPWEDKGKFRGLFRSLFPTVYEIFSLIKQKDHSCLPVILQSVESEIILNRVTRSVGREHPNLPIFTIHDSVVTLASEWELVRDRLKMEFDIAMRLEPSLQPEFWEPSKSINSFTSFQLQET